MRNVLADLCVESEAATVTAMRLARAYDRRATTSARLPSRASRPRSRSTGSASAAPAHAAEALECLGGNGYVEESGMPRAVPRRRRSTSIWEGSGNVDLPRRPAGAAPRARIGGGAPRRDPPRGRAAARAAGGVGARRRATRAPRAGWSNGLRWRCRGLCSYGTPLRRSPTRSSTRASRAATRPTGFCPRARISAPWWNGTLPD